MSDNGVYTDGNKGDFQPDPCPLCGSPGVIDWASVRAITDPEDSFVPGYHSCSESCAEDLPAMERGTLRLQHRNWDF